MGCAACGQHFPDVAMVIDAGLGLPSHAAMAMELGYDAVLLNTAVSKAGDSGADGQGFCVCSRGWFFGPSG